MLRHYQSYPIPRDEKLLDRLIMRLQFGAGICPICGSITIFYKFSENLRETGTCIVCRSTNRHRQVAQVLLNAIAEMTGTSFSSIKAFAQNHPTSKSLIIYNTETTNPLHHQLKNYPGYLASEYLEGKYVSGEVVNGVLHQDLMAPSFANNSIDLMLSSDVFEHIPDPYLAFSEVHRILKPRGRHIFTVPFYQERYRDEIRTILETDGTIKYLLPPIYHGDPLRPEGILVYVIFSLEMLLKLSDMGYQLKMYKLHDFLRGILGANAIVFESIK
ncbi:MAG: class I SAM-dependent methyltransferase [Scytolyngbya sp. HA4215-MV1]|jgi:SAM-dependent methyltransferase|nr:class I SAM-dependent methyltransferase [Scytolyngbya sp. HA4215-MV1]